MKKLPSSENKNEICSAQSPPGWFKKYYACRGDICLLLFVSMCLLFLQISITLIDLWILVIVSCLWNHIIQLYYSNMKVFEKDTLCGLIGLHCKLGCNQLADKQQIIKAFIEAMSRGLCFWKADASEPLWYKSVSVMPLPTPQPNVTYRLSESCQIACVCISHPARIWQPELAANRSSPRKGKRLFPIASDSPLFQKSTVAKRAAFAPLTVCKLITLSFF